MTSLKYRPDIDGLRTLAVVPVVLFHAGATWIPGGFVGVDIFFVISGYLITSIIMRELQSGEFSFLRFYERRIRRIIPALLVVVLATVVSAGFISLPDQLEGTAKSAIAAMLSVSNIWFWTQSGYFSTSAEFMPLLHTWSLAVEEQFYFTFPLLLVALTRIGLSPRIMLTVAIVPAYAFSLWMSAAMPSAAFYLLPARAWELGLGAALAAGVFPHIRLRAARELISIAGIFLIIFGLFYIDQSMLFPGWVALLPCVGAAMVIHSAEEGGLAHRLLSSRPVVFIGLISYSLYLWHWPILTWLRLASADLHLPLSTAAIGVALSLVLAVLSWRFIEKPFRSRTGEASIPLGRGIKVLASASAAIAAVCIVLIVRGGFPERLGNEARQLLAGSTDTEHFQVCPQGVSQKACTFGKSDAPVRVALIGDSHTPVLRKALEPIADQLDGQGVVWWHSACPLLEGSWIENDGYRSACLSFKEQVFDEVRRLRDLDLVILAGSWVRQAGINGSGWPLVDSESAEGTHEESRRVLARSLGRTLEIFAQMEVPVLILGAAPGAGFDVPRTLALAALNGVSKPHRLPAEAFRQANEITDRLISDTLREHRHAVYIPVWDVFCPDDFCAVTSDDHPLYSDSGHLSGRGATEFLGPELVKRIRDITPSLVGD